VQNWLNGSRTHTRPDLKEIFLTRFSFSRQPKLRLFERILASHGYASHGDDFRFTPIPEPMVISVREDGSALFGRKFPDRAAMSRYIGDFENAFPGLSLETYRKNILVLHGPKDDVLTAVLETVLGPFEVAETNAQFSDIVRREFGATL
jgi:hypothetical protein